MPSTIRDVARAAGVSSAAVSKVLHGGTGTIRVSEVRAAHIRQIAGELNYSPNILARSLRGGKTHTIGLVFENFGSIASGPLYYPYVLDAVASELFRQKYRLTILPEIDGNDPDNVDDGRLDGLIWCKLDQPGSVSGLMQSSTFPVVALNSPRVSDQSRAVHFACDNHQGSALVVEHLLGLGHRKILFLMERGEETTPDAVARLEGFHAAMSAAGLEVQPEDVLYWEHEVGEFVDWWKSNPPHTAIYAWNEGIASEVLHRVRANGVAIPTELSVVGFDSTAFCDATTPKLTAVNQPIREMARAATQTLLGMLCGKPPEQKSFVFPCTLDVRGSTSQPRLTS